MVYKLVRPFIFREDEERAHARAIRALQIASEERWFRILSRITEVTGLRRTVFGIDFPNPVGLAAGFIKNGEASAEMLGFGFQEFGTFVPIEQPGNPQPRLFRLPEDVALINAMGFNSGGLREARYNLVLRRRSGIPVGINVGKNKNTQNEDAEQDYCAGIRVLYHFGDYFVANVSSPNTPGLRELQRREPLIKLAKAMKNQILECAEGKPPKPFLLKISPDLTPEQREDIAAVVVECGIDGVIDGNTTMGRPDGLKSPHKSESGGLSGEPLRELAFQNLKETKRLLPNTPVVSVGGIGSVKEALRRFDAGAALIQVLSLLIYEGPFLARRINDGLARAWQV